MSVHLAEREGDAGLCREAHAGQGWPDSSSPYPPELRTDQVAYASAAGRPCLTTMWPVDRPARWVGHGRELAALRAAAEALGHGEGALVWIEGEPGIGKSSLVAEGLAAASDPGWNIGWGVADKLTERLPLRVMLDCLQVRPGSPDRGACTPLTASQAAQG